MKHKSPSRELLKWYIDLKSNRQCIDCGAGLLYFQLDFDHLPCYSKSMDVSRMVRLGLTKEAILEEMHKCVLVCKNCHALRTWKRNHKVSIMNEGTRFNGFENRALDSSRKNKRKKK